MYFVAFLYSVLHGSNVWRYVFRKNVRFKGAFLCHTKLNVSKTGSVMIGEKCQMYHCTLSIADGGGAFLSQAIRHVSTIQDLLLGNMDELRLKRIFLCKEASYKVLMECQ